MELRLIKKEELSRPVDLPEEAVANVSLRRLQNFEVRKGMRVQWSFRSEEDLLESGTVTVGEEGVLTISSMTISTAPQRLVVTKKEKVIR